MRWFISAVAVIALSSCRKSTQPPVAGGPSLADSAEQVMFDTRWFLTERGVKRGETFADTVYVFSDQSRFVMRRVRANFNTPTGAPNGTLKGDRGTYDRRTEILEGYGNVVVTSTDGRRLHSNHLRYAQAANAISSDSAFTFYRGKDIQKGIGFVTDPNITVFRCLRACRTEGDVQLGNLTP